jgi:hypothetical protein
MKTLRLIFPLLILSCNVFSNLSIFRPNAEISEIYIESPNTWSVELGFRYDTVDMKIDSIAIETKAGISRVKNYSLSDVRSSGSNFIFLSVISNSNLEKMLDMIRENDFVKVCSYVHGTAYYDSLAFGQYPGSYFLTFEEGFSIARYASLEFSLDKSPSIGEINSEDGMLGTAEGFVTSKNHEPMAKTTIGFGSYILTDENGYYNTLLPSRSYYTDTIWTSENETYIFKPDTINVQPDSTSYADIVVESHWFHSSVINGYYYINPESLTNYPNPFKELTTFFICLPHDFIENKTVSLQIYNNMGQTVSSFRFPDNISSIALPSDVVGCLKAGTYYYTLVIDGIPIGETKTMVKIP